MTEPATSLPFRLRVRGDFACFSRPELKVERVTYDVMTPSAARGILEAILWKPQMRWVVERIDVMAPINRARVRRNEVGFQASEANIRKAMAGTQVSLGIDIEDARQQRAAVILRDVDYIIHARIQLTDRAGADDPLVKYVEMFRRRAASGQCYHRPYLGTREFAAEFNLVEDATQPAPIDLTTDLGVMLYDIEYAGHAATPLFFFGRLEHGTLGVPAPGSTEVLR